MSEKIAISVRNVTKTYRLYNSHAERVKEVFHPFRKKYHHNFNALSDISFKVKKGETLGIIGRNGSGKSTLLQIICGVLQPTSGRVEVQGRVSTLLELGAGFNPEFSGRENVHINASILGLTKEEIDLRFDEIVAFADIGDFIEQPVKTYSSGMHVRLAFAVSACVEPDLLIVDEALAVGDVKFQARCFRRFEELLARGTTILFVTHDTDQITRHCTRGIVLDAGKIFLESTPGEAASCYLDLIFGVGERKTQEFKISDNSYQPINPKIAFDKLEERDGYNSHEYRIGNRNAEIVDARVKVTGNNHSVNLFTGDKITILIIVKFNNAIEKPLAGFQIKSPDGILIYGVNSTNYTVSDMVFVPAFAGDVYCFAFKFELDINSGEYLFSFGVSGYDGGLIALDWRHDVIHFNVKNNKSQPTGLIDLRTSISSQKILPSYYLP